MDMKVETDLPCVQQGALDISASLFSVSPLTMGDRQPVGVPRKRKAVPRLGDTAGLEQLPRKVSEPKGSKVSVPRKRKAVPRLGGPVGVAQLQRATSSDEPKGRGDAADSNRRGDATDSTSRRIFLALAGSFSKKRWSGSSSELVRTVKPGDRIKLPTRLPGSHATQPPSVAHRPGGSPPSAAHRPHQLPKPVPPPPPQLVDRPNETRLFAKYRKDRARGRITVRLGGNTGGSPEPAPPQRLRWRVIRGFYDWLVQEKRKSSRRAKGERLRQERSARKEEEDLVRRREESQAQREDLRATHEALQVRKLSASDGGDGPRAAAAFAAAAQDLRATKADALPADVKHSSQPGTALWQSFGGPAVETMLEDLDLIDARYLMDLADSGGTVPRWQQVPPTARIGRKDCWRLAFSWQESDGLAVLCLSYAWLDREHPDRMGETLRRVRPILSAMLSAVKDPCGTVGVMWDYMSLPQAPRSPEEDDRFRRGLRQMNSWYMHPFTHVLLMSSALPRSVAYTNTRPWDRRGWCFFEACASALVKHESCLWDEQHFDVAFGFFARQETLDSLRKTLRAGRRSPLSPTEFAAEMRRRVEDGSLAFTAGKVDMDTVIQLYERGFVAAFDSFPRVSQGHNIISFFGLGFGAGQAESLISALAFVREKCTFPNGPVRISAEGNGFSEDSKATLRDVVSGCTGIEDLYL